MAMTRSEFVPRVTFLSVHRDSRRFQNHSVPADSWNGILPGFATQLAPSDVARCMTNKREIQGASVVRSAMASYRLL